MRLAHFIVLGAQEFRDSGQIFQVLRGFENFEQEFVAVRFVCVDDFLCN